MMDFLQSVRKLPSKCKITIKVKIDNGLPSKCKKITFELKNYLKSKNQRVRVLVGSRSKVMMDYLQSVKTRLQRCTIADS